MMFKGDGASIEAVTKEGKETILARTTDFEGKLKADGEVRIYGIFNGEIETAGTVVVGKAAVVTATVTAKNVTIGGTVKGNMTASGRVEILSGGKVYGNIASSSLKIDEGALFSGQSMMEAKEGGQPLFKSPEPAPEVQSKR
ncbi:MAG: polymer-forming cytoskeletal protein [Chloroflexota bacterium]